MSFQSEKVDANDHDYHVSTIKMTFLFLLLIFHVLKKLGNGQFVVFFMLVVVLFFEGLFRLLGRDEELLILGLVMNDLLQGVLTRHDGMASGAPLPNLKKNVSVQQTETPDANAKAEATDSSTPAENGIGKCPSI